MADNQPNNKQDCSICGDDRKHTLFTQKFSRLSVGSLMDGYDVVICEGCGFAFADGTPDQKVFDLYYREMSKYEHQDNAGQPSEFESRQFPALAQYIQQFVNSSEARILELGCANGGLLNALKQLGYSNILGVDPSPVCAQNATQLYQIRVLSSSISDLDAEIGQFDFVILVAVLEHIKDLRSTLKIIRELIAEGGRLYVEVPDVTQFASSPDAPFQEFSIEHINFFSPISLKNLMSVYGFSQVSTAQISYEQTDTHTGHALRMIFQKGSEIKDAEITMDNETEPALEQYIANSRGVEVRIHNVVNALVEGGEPLIVWGAGTHTQRLLATSRLQDANIIAFVDSNSNYQGKQLNRIPIVHPGQLTKTNAPILVSSRIFQSEIVRQIRSELKLENNIFTLYED